MSEGFRKLVFLSSPAEDFSLVIDYRAIGVHAICHSPDIYKHQCIYCQVSDPTAETEWPPYTSPGCVSDEIQMEEVGASPAEVAQAQNPCIEEVLFSPKDASQSRSVARA